MQQSTSRGIQKILALYNIPPLDAKSFSGGPSAGLHDLDLPDAYWPGAFNVGILLEGVQLGSGAVGPFVAEVHAFEANPLQEPIGVRRRLQHVPFVLESLQFSCSHLICLSVECRLEFGGHPA